MTARQAPCDRCGAIYTSNRICANCLALGAAAPVREDRFADVRAAARTVTTPETRRMGVVPGTLDVTYGPALVDHSASISSILAELETLDAIDAVPVDRHAAITKLTDYIASGALGDMAVEALLAHAEILKGRAA